MKDLLIKALDEAFVKLNNQTPPTKNKTIYVNIESVNPSDINTFIKDNNIPEDCYFGGEPNGYDSFDTVCLCYDIQIPLTEKELLLHKQKKFDSVLGYILYDLLVKNNDYKRVPYDAILFRQFNKKPIYDMYIEKDFDMLLKYFSLRFTKII
jgi:hypothetical protein